MVPLTGESGKIIEAIAKEIKELEKQFRDSLYLKSIEIKCLKEELGWLKYKKKWAKMTPKFSERSLLFLTYINDLPKVSDQRFTILFADDTCIDLNYCRYKLLHPDP